MMSNAGAGDPGAALRPARTVLGRRLGLRRRANAIGAALRTIQAGEADAVVTGGSEAALTPLSGRRSRRSTLSRRLAIRARSTRAATASSWARAPASSCSRTPRRRRPAARQILGRVRGYGATCDAHHLTAPEPEGVALRARSRAALDDAGSTPADLALRQRPRHFDAAERSRRDAGDQTRAWASRATSLPVSSTKSAIGHLLGAAGAVEAVATLLALRDRVAPPTLGWEEPDEGLDLDYVPGRRAR